jgi:drug/metabolite transporter (DMT)-like permease
MTVAAGLLPAAGSAVLFASASALQHTQVRAVARRGALDARLLYDLARRGRWWLGLVADVAAVALQLMALHVAPVAFVQGVLVLGLPLAVVLTTRSRLLHRQAVVGTVLTTVGVGFFAAAQPPEHPEPGSGLALLVPVAMAVAAALYARHAPTVLVGAAAGVAAGAAAALMAAAAAHPLTSLATRPEAWLAAGAGLLALQLSQSALRGESAGAPLAALTLAEPVTAVALAAVVLRQHPALPPLALLAALAAAAGVLLLDSAPVQRFA